MQCKFVLSIADAKLIADERMIPDEELEDSFKAILRRNGLAIPEG